LTLASSAPARPVHGGHGTEPPSAWVQRWSHLIKPGGTVLDVACGRGRHTHWFHAQGHAVTAVDRSASALAAIDLPASTCEKVAADIEAGPWPFEGRCFDAVVVTHYLWRPLLGTLVASLAPEGVLIYETFTQGNETVGKPARPDFLLTTGELLSVCSGLRIVAFEDGFEHGSEAGSGSSHPPDCTATPRFIQRIAAVREHSGAVPARYPLNRG
jgi:SAM-dependent methyltransferase